MRGGEDICDFGILFARGWSRTFHGGGRERIEQMVYGLIFVGSTSRGITSDGYKIGMAAYLPSYTRVFVGNDL